MIRTVGKDELARMFRGAAASVRREEQQLSELDSVGGDGDHGATMMRAVAKLEEMTIPERAGDLTTILREAGWSVLAVDGGASSSLLGMFFSGMSDGAVGSASLDCGGLTAAFEAGLKALTRQTRAVPGDKTMMDALIPAVRALRAAADDGRCITEALEAAARAARAGAESTKNLTAHYGRAKHLGEKTLGYPDAGATSIALIFEGFYNGLAESNGGGNG
jgi:dihydroxyacetone kinase-like protein